MKLSQQERQGIVKHLVANSDAWKQPGDEQVLNTFSDDKLIVLKEDADRQLHAIQVANVAVNGFSDGETSYRVNPETLRVEKMANNAKKKAPPEDDGDDDEPDSDPDDSGVPASMKRKMARNSSDDHQARPRTVEDWFRNAPAEVQEERRVAQAIVDREKDAVINQLLANVSEADRPVHRERLKRRSLDDLHYDLSLLPKAPTGDEIGRGAGVPAANRRGGKRQTVADDDMLALPVTNWRPVGEEDATVKQQAPIANDCDEGMTTDDWLKTAPPDVRKLVQNAAAVEGRERRRMIDALVANFQGSEEQEKAFINRMEDKTIQELQDMLNLIPKRGQPTQANYFSPTPLANSIRSSDVTEDVLPLPRMDYKVG